MGRIFKLRNRRHHPATESAYKKSILSNLKTILFSSWVNLLLVFVPIVRPQKSPRLGLGPLSTPLPSLLLSISLSHEIPFVILTVV